MDIEALRRDTPGCAHRTHLNNAGAGLLSRRTLETMTAHLELEATIGGYEAAHEESERIAAVYADIAELVGGRADEVALSGPSGTWATIETIAALTRAQH